MSKFYVYAYLKRNTEIPYYVGKGTGKRAYVKHSWVSVPKDKSMIVFIETDLEDAAAFELEKKLIAKWGRRNNSTGVLLNLTDGGEGVSGFVMHESHKQIISQSHKILNQNLIWKEERLDSIKKSNQDALGVNFPLENSHIRAKCNDTLSQKYGVMNCSQIPEVKLKKSDNQKSARQRSIVQQIIDLNGKRQHRKILLGKGWYRKSDEELQPILEDLTRRYRR